MFLGPLDAMKPWSTAGIEGISRFLKRVWREFIDETGSITKKFTAGPDTKATVSLLNETILKVGEDIEELRLNTAISQLMICLNHLQKEPTYSTQTAKDFIKILAPLAPHLAEEIWNRFGEQTSISCARWPQADLTKCTKDEMKIVCQVNGKVRGEIIVPIDTKPEKILSLAKNNPRVATFLKETQVVKEIYVPGKIVNLVVR